MGCCHQEVGIAGVTDPELSLVQALSQLSGKSWLLGGIPWGFSGFKVKPELEEVELWVGDLQRGSGPWHPVQVRIRAPGSCHPSPAKEGAETEAGTADLFHSLNFLLSLLFTPL